MKTTQFNKYYNDSSQFGNGMKSFMFLTILILWILSIIYNNIPLAIIGSILCLDWILSEIKYNIYNLHDSQHKRTRRRK